MMPVNSYPTCGLCCLDHTVIMISVSANMLEIDGDISKKLF